MKRTFALMLIFIMPLAFSACGESGESVPLQSEASEQINMPESDSSEIEPDENEEAENGTVPSISIAVGDSVFSAKLYDNNTTKALLAQLPLTLSMSELNGNEKYYYLQNSLPTDAEQPEIIKTGDLMLYGSDCLVLFYESFSTSYSYTPLGHIEDASGLANALGNSSVEVTFDIGS